MKRFASGLGLIVATASCASAPAPTPAPLAAPSAWVRPPRPSVEPSSASPGRLERVQNDLPNGLRVIVIPRKGYGTVSTRLVFLQGVATEPKVARGSTLLAVALLGDFREEYEQGGRIYGEKSLRAQVWFKGAAYAWDVGHDYAMIGLDGYAREVDEYLSWLADAVMRPRRGVYTFGARRDAIIHALEDIELSDDVTLRRTLERAAFGTAHPYARALEGTEASLKQIGHEQVVWRQQALLNPSRMALVVVGDVDPQAVLRAAYRKLGRLRAKTSSPSRATRIPPARGGADSVSLIPQAHSRLMTVCAVSSVHDPSVSDEALEALAEHLGGGLRSALVRRLRVEAGLVYFAFSQAVLRKGARGLVSCTRTPARATAQVLVRMKAVLEQVRLHPVAEGDLVRVRAQLHAARRRDRASIQGILEAEIDRLARGVPEGPPRIDGLDAAQIAAAAAAALDPERVRFILAGPEIPAVRGAQAAKLGRTKKVSAAW